LLAQEGNYLVKLVGWNTTSSCADSAVATIVVYDSLIFHLPNIFTPNNDGINDLYTIRSNQDLELEYRIVNRWGNEMEARSIHIEAGVSTVLWDGANAVDGVYFIHLKAVTGKNKTVPLNGFITLER
jgi:gliding motility-associated-like protein